MAALALLLVPVLPDGDGRGLIVTRAGSSCAAAVAERATRAKSNTTSGAARGTARGVTA